MDPNLAGSSPHCQPEVVEPLKSRIPPEPLDVVVDPNLEAKPRRLVGGLGQLGMGMRVIPPH